LSSALPAQLGRQSGDMILYSLFCQEHSVRDLLVGQTVAEQAQQRPFLFGKAPMKPRRTTS